MALRELCTRFSGIFIQNVTRSTEFSAGILKPLPVTVWSVAYRSQTPLALRKQSRTSYLIFAGDKRSDVMKANPGIGIPELGRILGQMWRSLSEENKEAYRRRYQDEKEIFMAKKNAELDSLTEAEKSELYQQKEDKLMKRKTRKEKQLLKQLMKPRPTDVNPFVLFFKSKSAERGDTPVSVFLKRQSDVWKSMSDQQRKPFVDQAQINSARYHDELKRWEMKMFTQGNTDVLNPIVIRKLQGQTSTRSRAKRSMMGVATSSKALVGRPKKTAIKPPAASGMTKSKPAPQKPKVK